MTKIQTIAVLLVWFLGSSAAIAADAIGSIVAIQGKATATSVDGESRRLELKSAIFLNDKIVTEDRSKIQIMFEDDSFLSQGEKSEMTIDEYVYKPKDKEKANCSMKLLKGIFSVVTGKITDMNPERFKVRTRMATIGIRGCELGFSVREEKEDVYILHLPKGKSIVIQKTLTPGRALDTIWLRQVEVLNIVRAGVAVSIQEGLKLEERPTTMDELRQIIEQSTFGLPSSDDGEQSSSRSSGSALAKADVGGMKLREITDTVSAASATKAEADRAGEGEKDLEEEKESLSIFARPSDEDTSELPPKPPAPTEAPSAPYVPYGYPPLPGIGTDWAWGFFGDGSYSFSGNSLSTENYLTIVNDAQLYSLTGSGAAAAALYHDGIIKFVDGPCTLNVQVGDSGNSHAWDGTFDMDNGYGDSLVFGAVGNIGSGGVLSGLLDEGGVSYSLQVNEQTFVLGDVTSETIDGKLVGLGITITGAVGDYEFQHGGAATVKGVFGADISSP